MKRWIIGTALAGMAATGGTFAADAQINPYDDKGTHYELPIISEIPQGERVEIAKDRPEITLKGWNDEYAIKITPQVPTSLLGANRAFGEASRPLLAKRMEYKSGNVAAFVEPRFGNEFDIDFMLDSKPDTNVFTYKIEGAEDFDFFYQPELTPEEIAEGAERPENAIGSYAVYHKTKTNHRLGSTNYATGKAFHIYRPKAIDANGEETWADLSYTASTLRVHVSQQWLDKAAYPVVIDPTFGYTSIGATSLGHGLNSVYSAKFSSPADIDTVQSLTAYIRSSSGTRNFKGLILLASTRNIITNGVGAPVSIPTTAQWHVSNTAANPSLTPSTEYYLGTVSDSGSVATNYDNASANTSCFDFSNSYSTPQNFGGACEAAGTHQFSIYATYTASGGGGTAAPQQEVIWFE